MTTIATRELTYGEAINEAMHIAMRQDPTVILMGEDVAGGAAIDHLAQDEAWGGVLGVTKGLVKEFGRSRVLDTPITEAGFIGAAVGAAATGLRPIAELMFVDFCRCQGPAPERHPRRRPGDGLRAQAALRHEG